MMNKIDIISTFKNILFIAIVIGGFYFMFKQNQALREEVSNYKNNTVGLIEKQAQKYINLNKNDIDLIPSIKHILDSLDIRPKEINQYYTTDYHYHYGDTIVRPIVKDSNGIGSFALDTLCLSLSGTIDYPNIYFNDIDFRDELDVFLYRKRKHTLNLGLFKLHLGKWQNKVKAISKCSGDTLPITVYDFE